MTKKDAVKAIVDDYKETGNDITLFHDADNDECYIIRIERVRFITG